MDDVRRCFLNVRGQDQLVVGVRDVVDGRRETVFCECEETRPACCKNPPPHRPDHLYNGHS